MKQCGSMRIVYGEGTTVEIAENLGNVSVTLRPLREQKKMEMMKF